MSQTAAKPPIIAFTDGSCINNGKKNPQAGIGVFFPNSEYQNISEKYTNPPITNQRAELYAILKCLQAINMNNHSHITITTDSLYSIKCLTVWIHTWIANDWKSAKRVPVKNKDIIQPIYDILTSNPNKITFKHVQSHTNNGTFESEANNAADKLATNGAAIVIK